MRDEGVVTLHLPIGCIVPCWSRYQDVNPIPTISLADDLATAPYTNVSGCACQ